MEEIKENFKKVIHLIIDPSNKREEGFKLYLDGSTIKYHLLSSTDEFKKYFLDNVDDEDILQKKHMIWIHPQLGSENQDLNNMSDLATLYENNIKNEIGKGKLYYKKLSRIPLKKQTDEFISLSGGFKTFVIANYDKFQTFQMIHDIVFEDSIKIASKDISKDKQIDNSPNNHCDVLIISALQTEFQSLYEIGLFDLNNKQDIFGCFTNQIESKNGKNIIIKGYPVDNTGMVDAAIHTSRLIEKLNPQYVIMNGVCGGNPKKKKKDGEDKGIWFCDIVIPNKVFTYQKGKVTDTSFEKEPERIEIDTINKKIIGPIKDRCKVVETNENISSFQQRIYNSKKSLYEAKGIKELKVLFDSMACGTAVISKKQFFTKEVERQDRNAIALEMESYAVIRACQLAKVTGIIIKSIMDFTTEKADGYKELAEYTSAKMTELVIKEVLQYD